jgi:hypothetical protein
MPNRNNVIARVTSGCALTCALLASVSCGGGDDDSEGGSGSGTLVIPFELGNMRPCDALMVKTVRADLNDEEITQTVNCTNGEVRIRNLRAGSYTILLYGENADEVAIMDSSQVGPVTVNVAGGDNTTVVKPPVTLTAAAAKLYIRWTLGFGSCKGVDIESFYVKVWRRNGDELLLSATLDCELEGDDVDQYRVVPDPNRALGGGDVGEVTVAPLDHNGTVVGMPVSFKFDSPGAGKDIRLSVSCTDGACRGSGKPDVVSGK